MAAVSQFTKLTPPDAILRSILPTTTATSTELASILASRLGLTAAHVRRPTKNDPNVLAGLGANLNLPKPVLRTSHGNAREHAQRTRTNARVREAKTSTAGRNDSTRDGKITAGRGAREEARIGTCFVKPLERIH